MGVIIADVEEDTFHRTPCLALSLNLQHPAALSWNVDLWQS